MQRVDFPGLFMQDLKKGRVWFFSLEIWLRNLCSCFICILPLLCCMEQAHWSWCSRASGGQIGPCLGSNSGQCIAGGRLHFVCSEFMEEKVETDLCRSHRTIIILKRRHYCFSISKYLRFFLTVLSEFMAKFTLFLMKKYCNINNPAVK